MFTSRVSTHRRSTTPIFFPATKTADAPSVSFLSAHTGWPSCLFILSAEIMPKVTTSPRRVRFAPFARGTPDAIDEILLSLEDHSPQNTVPPILTNLRWSDSPDSNGQNVSNLADRLSRPPVAHLFINNKAEMSKSKDWTTVFDPVSKLPRHIAGPTH